MIRLIPDWLLYIVVIAVVVVLLFAVDRRSMAPEALPDAPETGGFLPPPSVYDPEILVEVGPQSSGLGSAFAVSPDGWWITARHVSYSMDQGCCAMRYRPSTSAASAISSSVAPAKRNP